MLVEVCFEMVSISACRVRTSFSSLAMRSLSTDEVFDMESDGLSGRLSGVGIAS